MGHFNFVGLCKMLLNGSVILEINFTLENTNILINAICIGASHALWLPSACINTTVHIL